MNPTDHLPIWLAVMAGAAGLAGWNISRLRAVRPAIDWLVAVLGAAAILAVVIGASLVVTEVTECSVAVSRATCSRGELLLVAVMDLLAAAALTTLWLRADTCQLPQIPQTRQRTQSGTIVVPRVR